MWRGLRQINRLRKTRFRRQAPIGPFIADFACFRSKLVIEVDGGQHSGTVADRRRDAWLKCQGFATLRFWNTEIAENQPGVLAAIDSAVTPRSRDPQEYASTQEERPS